MSNKNWTRLCGTKGNPCCPEYRETDDGGIEIRDLDQHDDRVIVLNKEQVEKLFVDLSLSK